MIETAKSVDLTNLKAALAEVDKTEFNQGVEAGEQWAQGVDNADDAKALRRLARHHERNSGDWESLFVGKDNSDACWVYDEMFGEDAEGQCEFWLNVSGSEEPDGEFVRGFCEGALRIYRLV